MNKKFEMRIYEFLGIKIFRKMVFALEKLIHNKDKGLNINYHVPCVEIGALDAFVKYLFYNGAIHVRNIIFFAVYVLLKIVFHWKFRIFDIVLCLLAIKDIYCVMLQRYNMLRIKYCKELLAARQERKKEKALEKCRDDFSASYDFSFAESDLALVKRLKSSLENRESIVLSESDILALNRLLLTKKQEANDTDA